jgi:hypothetical protein
MIYGTFLGKTLEPYRSDKGDFYGATVAENRLLEASLAVDTTLKWEFWKPGLPLSVTRNLDFRAGVPDLTLLRRQFETRVLLRSLPTLPTHEEAREYIFVGGATLLPMSSDVREQLFPDRLPICGILHLKSPTIRG